MRGGTLTKRSLVILAGGDSGSGWVLETVIFFYFTNPVLERSRTPAGTTRFQEKDIEADAPGTAIAK